MVIQIFQAITFKWDLRFDKNLLHMHQTWHMTHLFDNCDINFVLIKSDFFTSAYFLSSVFRFHGILVIQFFHSSSVLISGGVPIKIFQRSQVSPSIICKCYDWLIIIFVSWVSLYLYLLVGLLLVWACA